MREMHNHNVPRENVHFTLDKLFLRRFLPVNVVTRNSAFAV